MNVLFVHNNFPAQFVHVARALSQDPSVRLAAVGSPTARNLKGVKLLKYPLARMDVSATHPFARRFDIECRRAEQVLYNLSNLTSSGFHPDVILAHPGWGESLPLRTLFPKSRIIAYCEYFYGAVGRDVKFDAEFPATGADGDIALQLRNAANLLALVDCDGGLAPTKWQHSTFPNEFQSKIKVIHEGVDTDLVKPDERAALTLPNGLVVTRRDEVVTFVARNLEPLRGYHIFLRSLPKILAQRPNAQVIIVGGDGTSYGAHPPTGKTWKAIFFDEIKDRIDRNRIHFMGKLKYEDYLRVLQVSSAHVYLTYPFVASWSLLEAMSAGCLVIGSDTAPVREFVGDDTGIVVPFFDTDMLAYRVIEALADQAKFRRQRDNARQLVMNNYHVWQQCVPKMVSYMRDGIDKPSRAKLAKVG